MQWHKKADLEALFGENVDASFFGVSGDAGGASLRGGTLLAPAGPLNPPGPTALAPRPGPMSAGPVLPPKPLPVKRIRRGSSS